MTILIPPVCFLFTTPLSHLHLMPPLANYFKDWPTQGVLYFPLGSTRYRQNGWCLCKFVPYLEPSLQDFWECTFYGSQADPIMSIVATVEWPLQRWMPHCLPPLQAQCPAYLSFLWDKVSLLPTPLRYDNVTCCSVTPWSRF